MLTALSGGQPDRIPWAPNFDHWLGVNSANGTLPKDLVGLSRNDIVRRIGGAIWARGLVCWSSYDEEVKVEQRNEPGRRETIYQTPVGTVSTAMVQCSDFTRAWMPKRHLIEGPQDLRVARFIFEHTRHRPAYTPGRSDDSFSKLEAEVGEDGIGLVQFVRCPYQEFMTYLAGWSNGPLLYADYPGEVEELFELMTEKSLEVVRIAADSPAKVIEFGDNMHGGLTSPTAFRKHILPFYRRAAPILRARGKIVGSHYDGPVATLLELLPESGLHFIEAFTPAPMGNCTLAEARAVLRGKVAIHGGLPACLVLPTVKPADFRAFLEELLRQAAPGDGFVLGMGDNVPPDANFDLVRRIAEILAEFGA
jgi:hypothetical protein